MRMIYILVSISILTFSICGCGNNEYKGEYSGTFTAPQIILEDVAEGDFEVTDDLAIDIGNAVIKSVYGEDAIQKTIYNLSYLKNDNLYWFSRIVEKPDISFGGDYNVAINKNGKIEAVWLSDR